MKALPFLLIALLLGFWEFGTSRASQVLFPPPSTIAMTLYAMRMTLTLHALKTLTEIVCSLCLALPLSMLMAYAMLLIPWCQHLVAPFLVLFQAIPLTVLAPLLILSFGFGHTALLLPITLMMFFPLTMNLFQGFRNTPVELEEYFFLHHASRWDRFRKLYLPHALPQLFAGLRICLSVGASAAMAGELMSGQQGLGVLLLESKRTFDMPALYATVCVITGMSLGLFSLGLKLEHTLLQRFRFVKA